ncbi:hypothetical protein ACFXG6_30465 [Streptomyces roseus]|uniref:hypothetical protein n=1 Tax=Streptomyces roseus TaxID=66430 RepID=UPI0036B2BF1C
MSATVQTDAFLVCEADDATATTAPLDVTVISESVSIVLEARASEPPAALRQLWFRWLAGHLHLLMPLIEVRPWLSRNEGLELLLQSTRDDLDAGLPEQAADAYVRLRELARICRFLLGLAIDQPGACR